VVGSGSISVVLAVLRPERRALLDPLAAVDRLATFAGRA
jgi:hypothetical protein